jgi:hypothetical protein
MSAARITVATPIAKPEDLGVGSMWCCCFVSLRVILWVVFCPGVIQTIHELHELTRNCLAS